MFPGGTLPSSPTPCVEPRPSATVDGTVAPEAPQT
jgi:hypothetical protein